MVARNMKDPYPKDATDTPATRRRSVYMFHKRVVPYPLLQAFDGPDAAASCGRRDSTTVAPQALALLNDPFVRDRAADFARRLLARRRREPERWVERGFRAGARAAAERRGARGGARVPRRRRSNAARARDKAPPRDEVRRQALADFCQALFGLNEFIYVD